MLNNAQMDRVPQHDENPTGAKKRMPAGHRGVSVRRRRSRDIDVSSLTMRVRF